MSLRKRFGHLFIKKETTYGSDVPAPGFEPLLHDAGFQQAHSDKRAVSVALDLERASHRAAGALIDRIRRRIRDGF